MTEKEQAYVARYTFERPTITQRTRSTRHYLVLPALVDGFEPRRFAFWDSKLVVPLQLAGLTVEVEEHEDENNETAPSWEEAVRLFHKAIPEDLEGAFSIAEFANTASVRTETRLGQKTHRERTALLEAFLVQNGIAYTRECMVELSSNVCQPSSPEAIERARGRLLELQGVTA